MADAQITITANIRQAQQALANLNNSLGKIASLASLAASALAGFASQQATKGILDTVKAYEGFRTQLTTYLGSQQRANAEIDRLAKLARTLPQDVNEVTEAFVIFTRLGLDTSSESLRAFANIATANSKSFTQFAEAVADALTGEFERLKEFGIKVSRENDQFVARIGQQQVAVSRNTEDLVNQLRALGEEGGRFGSVTLGPLTRAFNDFKGTVIEAQAAIGGQGFALAVAEAVNEVSKFIQNNQELQQSIGRSLTRAFLYLKEIMIVLAKNIDIVGYAFAAVFGITILRAVVGLTAAIAGPLIAAFGLLASVLKATALLALRHPIIGGIAVVIGGIEYLTGAFSKLAKEIGLIGEDSAMNDLVEQGNQLANTVRDGIGGAFDYISDVQQRVNAAEEEFYQKTLQVNAAMTEQERTAAAIADQEAKKAELASQAAKAFAAALEVKYQELDLTTKTTAEQKLFNVQKEFEKKLGRELLPAEKEKLQVFIKQTEEVERQNKLRERSLAIGQDTIQGLIFNVIEEQKAINGVNEALMKQHGIRELLRESVNQTLGETYNLEALQQAELANLRIANAQRINDKIFEIEETRIRNLMMAERNGLNARISEYDRAVLRRIGQEEKNRQIVNERMEFEKKSTMEQTQFGIQKGAELFAALGAQNKKAFEAAKALNIANALMNTYTAATKALATYPWPFGLIAAAAAVAAGMAQVSAIRSQNYSGRALGGPVMGGTPYLVGENGPELFVPNSTGSITRNSDIGGNRPVNVTFNIVANDTAGFDDLLMSRRGLIRSVISDAMIESGRRG